jgi:cell division protein FtsW (lipid II flippase)
MWRISLLQATASGTATSTPRRIAFVPEQHVDFIFSVHPEKPSILALSVLIIAGMLLVVFLRRRRRRQPRDIS